MSSRVLVLAAFLTGRFARGDDADGFFMADHMYYKEKSFAFGVTDGGLAGFGRVAGVHNPDEGVKEHLAGGVERHAVFLNVGVCFVRVPLERDSLQFVLNPHIQCIDSVRTLQVKFLIFGLVPIPRASMTIRARLPYQFFE